MSIVPTAADKAYSRGYEDGKREAANEEMIAFLATRGYQYGEDAAENVLLGWRLARGIQ